MRHTNPTYKDIAKAANCSAATVSYAFNGNPTITKATRERILEIAEKLAYKPNSKVSEAMGIIRKNRYTPQRKDSIALYWSDGDRRTVEECPLFKIFEQALRDKLDSLGYGLDCFYGKAGGKFQHRSVERNLKARGIRGVILAPRIEPQRMTLNWDFESFSLISVGSGYHSPAFNRIKFCEQEGIELILEHLYHIAHGKIGWVTELGENGRVDDTLPKSCNKQDLHIEAEHLIGTGNNAEMQFLNWVYNEKPKTLICSSQQAAHWIQDNKHPYLSKLKLILTDVEMLARPHAFSGLYKNYALLGELTGTQIVKQLRDNSYGIPDYPVSSALAGQWVDFWNCNHSNKSENSSTSYFQEPSNLLAKVQ